MSDTKEYAALQEECERLRAENQRLNKCLARYRAKYGELSELDKGGEIGALSAVEIKSGESKVHALSSNVVLVTNQNPSEEKIKLFRSLFRGREDIYAKRWHSEKSGKSGYQPVCLNEWNTWLCDKRRTKCSECKNRKFAPLDDGAIYKHLQGKSPNGTDVVGIYPLTEDEHCYFLAMDFDGSSWEDDIVAVRAVCKKHEIPFLVERSRSGLGGHVWFFFADKVCAVNARKFGTLLLNGAMQMRHSIRFSAYDRLFPKRGILFNKTDFKRIFNEDITSAHKEILIVSPSLIAGRVTKFLRVYSTLLDKPNVTVVTRATDDEKTMQQLERLKRTGIAIQIHDDLHLRCAVIDGSLVWYGSISPLGCAGDTDSSLRFDSREIAEMLVSQLNPNV